MIRNTAMAAVVGLTAGAVPAPPANAEQVGGASWYALNSKTANGERMNPNAMTAAHRTLAFGTRVRVQNLGNQRSVVVRINDRGPFTRGRIIDVSRAAAAELGFVRAGTARVRVTRVGGAETNRASDAGDQRPASTVVWIDGRPHFGPRYPY